LSDASNSKQLLLTSYGQKMNQTIKNKLAISELKKKNKNKTFQNFSNEIESKAVIISL
jgi:hypothetical protein